MNGAAFARPCDPETTPETTPQTATDTTADSIVCDRCRGAFSLSAITSVITCPYCEHRQLVDRHDALVDYERAVDHRLAGAAEHHRIAAALEAWNTSEASSPARNLAVVYGSMIGLPLALAGVLAALSALGLLRSAGPGAALAIGAVSFGGLAGQMIWRHTRRGAVRDRSLALRATRVACPTCGAPGALVPGAAVDTCGFCDAALIPNHAQVRAGLDAARAAQRAAAIDRRREQRVAAVRATELGPFALLMPVVMIGSLLLMIGGTAVGYTVQMLRGLEPFHPGVFGVWALTLAIAGVTAAHVSNRRARRRALRAALGDVARQLGGRTLASARERVEWLNGFWGGDYDQRHIVAHTHLCCGVAASLGGYPALIDVELSRHKPAPRLDVYLGAWVPEMAGDDAASRKLRDRALSDLGFSVRTTAAGLVARAKPELLDAACRDADVVHVATTALDRLVRLAVERGYEPLT